MSDSGDTDILLLIPPNFFLSSTLSDEQLDENFAEELNKNMLSPDWESGQPQVAEGNYQYLPQTQQIELDNINARLTNIETNFSPGSDLSTISHCTVRSDAERRFRNTLPRPHTVEHSTPKDETRGYVRNRKEYHGVLKEIDHFLEDKKYNSFWNGNGGEIPHRAEEPAASLPNVLNRLNADGPYNEGVRIKQAPEEQLVSLSEMWSKNAPGNLTLKEERYRRLHLEKTIRSLQSKLLEYQQRISVALEVDKAKDNALCSAQAENNCLQQEVKRLKDGLCKIENEQQDLATKYEVIQKELAQALSMAAKFQDKNEKLENELQSFSRKTTECSGLYKRQIEELEIKLNACKKSEEFSIAELAKVKDRLAKAEYHEEKAATRCENLEKQLESIKFHKDQAQELMQKQRNRADQLEDQKKTLTEKLNSLSEKETALQKKLESQRQGLKLHYQQQLESVVAQKLKEFQQQLDKVEETLKQEMRDREHLIAERAIKQMELINEKNEQELNLLQEKHNEEVQLYRIQQANASKKINELETKLNSYKARRADIAEKLHSVMEAQWQKALEILTSPSTQKNENKSGSVENVQSTAENEQFETPKTSRHNREVEDVPHADQLQAYIDLLLSKSPQDIENLHQLFVRAKAKELAYKNKMQQRSAQGKPPWKG